MGDEFEITIIATGIYGQDEITGMPRQEEEITEEETNSNVDEFKIPDFLNTEE